jgi:hypothetical protein
MARPKAPRPNTIPPDCEITSIFATGGSTVKCYAPATRQVEVYLTSPGSPGQSLVILVRYACRAHARAIYRVHPDQVIVSSLITNKILKAGG